MEISKNINFFQKSSQKCRYCCLIFGSSFFFDTRYILCLIVLGISSSGTVYQQSLDDIQKRVKRQTVMNPDNQYEDGTTAESLFQKEEGHYIRFAQGVDLGSLSKDQCLLKCSEEDACASIQYLKRPGNCSLSTETKEDAAPYYFRNASWDYYEKTKDYFLIFHKETGRYLQARNLQRASLTSTINDNCYFFWSGQTIRPKNSPDQVLSAQGNFSGSPLWLYSYHPDSLQKWSYENNQLKLENSNGLQLSASNNAVTVTRSSVELLKNYWSLHLPNSYFVITHRGTGNVLTANSNDRVLLSEYNGEDEQFWFWDDEHIRPKKYTNKVLQNSNGISLGNLGSNLAQKWNAKDDDTIISSEPRFGVRFCTNHLSTSNGASISSCASADQQYPYIRDKWSFDSARMYFFILHKNSGKVITANSATTVKAQTYFLGTNQQWFWDGDIIRNKRYPDKVLTLEYTGIARDQFVLLL